MALSLQRYTYLSSDYEGSLFRILKERIENEREKSMVIEIKCKDSLTENLIFEILSWLPVKALLQFKSVCKSWYALISSPDFISKHLKNYYKNSDSDCLLAQYHSTLNGLQVFELLIDETETPRMLAWETLWHMPLYCLYICGPCDGLYFLGYSAKFGLWNPAINELKILPSFITKPDHLPSHITYAFDWGVHGLGYDPLTDDYKVVAIMGYLIGADEDDYNGAYVVEDPQSVLVYSLRTDAWRYCGDLSQYYYRLDRSTCYTFVNGCYYWLGLHERDANSVVIISFDMSTDTYEESINVPNFDQPAVHKSLAIYDDCLAFLTVHGNTNHFDIWTLNEGLWTKKFNIKPLTDVRNPVGHWKKNKFILELESGDSCLVVCDLQTQENIYPLIKTTDLAFEMFPSCSTCRAVYDYKESLVSVTDRNRWCHHQETEGVDHQV